ncbi:MAG: class A beta-lactamase-related serine hydrolase [Saprospiraceae bacterium]|nr:class A beta-lactamase-related serine hydrolase [Saprospiraceae bacterium]
MRSSITLILFIVFQAVSFGQAPPAKQHSLVTDKAILADRIDRLVSGYTDLGIFSGVVLVARDGVPLYEKAFGLANRQTATPNTLKTRFVIGSMNKSFTQVVIHQLVDEGKLRYADRLVDILDGFDQPDAPQITVRHLLEHTSGFGDYHTPEYWSKGDGKENIQGLTDLIRQQDLMFYPGEDQAYSNAGYILLGAIIEKTTGRSYAQEVRDRVVIPLGLKETYLEKVRNVQGRAIGYMKTLDGVVDNEEAINEPRSDGGFYATAGDVLIFYRHFFYDTMLVSPKARKESGFFRSIAPAYSESGAGIPLAGGFMGANTVHMEMPADQISIVVMANMDEPVGELICMGIHATIVGKEPASAVLPAKLNVHKAFVQYGEEYVLTHFDELTTNWHPADPRDAILNNLGYDLMNEGQVENAIVIFTINTRLFPDIANCWDSLGEALAEHGETKKAITAYRKALEIRPDLPTSIQALKRLDQGK